jgi:MFS transporter, DHA1 family, inner membrane transport protein
VARVLPAVPHTTVDGAPPRSLRRQLVVLTGTKSIANTALRWVGPFLPTLERAFGTTTATLTGIMGVAELGGLTTGATGPLLDRGHERTVFCLGLVAVAASSAIALGGSVALFAVSFVVLVLGVGNLTVAGHAWIAHRVPYSTRSRAIGSFETSWALALLLGAPLLALLIRWFGWRGPYVALACAAAVAATLVWALVAPGLPRSGETTTVTTPRVRLPRSAWPPMLATAAIAATGMSVFIVSGAWLDDAHGVSTGGLGLVAALFGALELVSSSSVALFADRVGARRSVAAGLVVLGCGLAIIATSGSSQALAIGGLAVFLTGFEYGFVSSLTLVSEAAPAARGRAIGLASMLGTLARSAAVIAAGQLYDAFGISGPVVWSAVTGSFAMAATIFSRLPHE